MIQEEIKLKDGVSGPANKAAKSVERLNKAIGKAKTSTDKAAVTAQKQEAKLAAARDAAFKKRGAQHRQEEAAEDRGMAGALGVVGAVLAIGAAAAAAAKKVIELGVEFTKAASDALDARREAEGMFGLLTGGRGKEAIDKVDKLGESLGLSMGEARQQFDKFRSAGLNNKQSAQLMKLRADIAAVGGEARGAEAEAKVLAAAKPGGAGFDEQMKALKVGIDGAGSGMVAAEKNAKTLGGALNQLKNAPARFFDSFVKAPAVSQALDKVGASVTKTIDELMKSPEAAKALAMIQEGFAMIMGIVAAAIPLVVPFFKGIVQAAEPIVAVLTPIGEAISDAFKDSDKVEMMETVMWGLGVAVVSTAAIFAIFAVAVGAVIGTLFIVPAAIGAVIYGLALLGEKVYETFSNWTSIGANAVTGLINGIKSKITDAVAAAKELATKVSGAIKDALKIGSPSKLFEQYGKFTVAGFAQGVDKSAPMATDSMAAIAPQAAPSANAAPRASSGGEFNLTINVAAQPGASKQDGENLAAGMVPMIRREIESFMHGMAAV